MVLQQLLGEDEIVARMYCFVTPNASLTTMTNEPLGPARRSTVAAVALVSIVWLVFVTYPVADAV